MKHSWTWILRMAWRDSRGSRRKLVLFLSSMVLGVAALVGISSFGENLERAIDAEAMALLGADLSFESGAPFPERIEEVIDSLGGEQARRVSFASMAYFPRVDGGQLATVRAMEGRYPFYGSVETLPADASDSYLDDGDALMDATLFETFGVDVGDSVQIGRNNYRIAGELVRTPRESAAMALFSPRIYIPRAGVDTLLLRRGSRVTHEVYFRFDDGRDVEALREELNPLLREHRVGSDTVEEVREDWNEGLTNLYRFLNLVGFIALLLGGVGVASAVHVYIKQRLSTVAVLRCLGTKGSSIFAIYLLQAGILGLIAGLAGCAIGLTLQFALPSLLSDVLPVAIEVYVAWNAILLGLGVGLGVTILFALLPLLSVRRITPLHTLRQAFDETGQQRDPWRWAIYVAIGASVALFAYVQSPEWEVGIGYAAGIGIVFGLLLLVAKAIIHFSRRFFPSGWPYTLRQGFSNLYRPNNQTVILMLALGLGTFLILTLYLVQGTLLNQIQLAGGENRPNLVLFDIQNDQVAGVSEAVESQDLPVLDQVPIVTMRVHSVKGRTVAQLRADSTRGSYTWAHRREYRSSYRDHLTDSETILQGDFVATASLDDGPVPISIEEEIAEEMGLDVGDEMVWDVQGVPIPTTIASIRRVDWQRVQTNFFVVFPAGVLEDAPQFHVVMTRTQSDEQAAGLQSALMRNYPNVSSINLSLILNVFDEIYSRVAFVLRFMALFSIFTGIIVLIGALSVSRLQRIGESVLLKTLGASRKQVLTIMLVEYALLGFFATLTGVILSLSATWALARFVFQTSFQPALLPLLAGFAIVIGLTMAIGWLNSRGIFSQSPLAILRTEAQI